MARYREVAVDAAELSKKLIASVPAELRDELSVGLVQLYNLGIRTAPRPVQGTVRLNACREMAKHLPVSVSMNRVENDRGGYNALSVLPIGQDRPA